MPGNHNEKKKEGIWKFYKIRIFYASSIYQGKALHKELHKTIYIIYIYILIIYLIHLSSFSIRMYLFTTLGLSAIFFKCTQTHVVII